MATEAIGAGYRSPTPTQLRAFALLSLLYAAVTVAVFPYASEAGPADANIVVVYSLGILIADLCTSKDKIAA